MSGACLRSVPHYKCVGWVLIWLSTACSRAAALILLLLLASATTFSASCRPISMLDFLDLNATLGVAEFGEKAKIRVLGTMAFLRDCDSPPARFVPNNGGSRHESQFALFLNFSASHFPFPAFFLLLKGPLERQFSPFSPPLLIGLN